MQLGMIGLGRMGGNIVRRLMRHGHSCVVYDRSADAVSALVKEGATGSGGLAEFVKELTAPKLVWVMLPAGKITHDTIVELSNLLGKGDILIDGFLCSGTTVIAAQRTGRRCYGIELDPVYVDTIIRRWQGLTGGSADHAASSRSFDDLAREAEAANG